MNAAVSVEETERDSLFLYFTFECNVFGSIQSEYISHWAQTIDRTYRLRTGSLSLCWWYFRLHPRNVRAWTVQDPPRHRGPYERCVNSETPFEKHNHRASQFIHHDLQLGTHWNGQLACFFCIRGNTWKVLSEAKTGLNLHWKLWQFTLYSHNIRTINADRRHKSYPQTNGCAFCWTCFVFAATPIASVLGNWTGCSHVILCYPFRQR